MTETQAQYLVFFVLLGSLSCIAAVLSLWAVWGYRAIVKLYRKVSVRRFMDKCAEQL